MHQCTFNALKVVVLRWWRLACGLYANNVNIEWIVKCIRYVVTMFTVSMHSTRWVKCFDVIAFYILYGRLIWTERGFVKLSIKTAFQNLYKILTTCDESDNKKVWLFEKSHINKVCKEKSYEQTTLHVFLIIKIHLGFHWITLQFTIQPWSAISNVVELRMHAAEQKIFSDVHQVVKHYCIDLKKKCHTIIKIITVW